MRAAWRSVIGGASIALLLLSVGCAGTRAAARRPAPVAAGVVHEPLGPARTPVTVREYGNAGAPSILLVHGVGTEAPRDFDAVIPVLARSFRVLAVHLPGYGSSPAPSVAYSPDDFVEVLADVVRQRNLDDVDVVGHSMGGAIALLFASKHPTEVRRLALFDVAGILYFRDYARTIMAGKLGRRGDVLDPFRGLAHGLLRVLSKPFSKTELKDLPVPVSATLKFIDYDFGQALRTIEAPVFLGWGRHDDVAPHRTLEALRFWLRPVASAMYESSAHVPMRTEPESVANDLASFFGSQLRPASRRIESVAAKPLKSYSCRGERGVVLQGEFDRIELDRCRDAELIGVRARSLHVSRSTVELRHVEVVSDDLAVTIAHSRVSWTGGRIIAPTGMRTERSRLNVAAVFVESTRNGLVAHRSSHVIASACGMRVADRSLALHGEYRLPRDLEPRGPPMTGLLSRAEQVSTAIPQ